MIYLLIFGYLALVVMVLLFFRGAQIVNRDVDESVDRPGTPDSLPEQLELPIHAPARSRSAHAMSRVRGYETIG